MWADTTAAAVFTVDTSAAAPEADSESAFIGADIIAKIPSRRIRSGDKPSQGPSFDTASNLNARRSAASSTFIAAARGGIDPSQSRAA
jgi:hypothetical protein